jgi:predicted Fe-Mo cluster-binding NifX family protein
MLAVPLHGEDVAPRFCSADEFMIVELEGGEARRLRRVTIPEDAWSQRLERLSAAGVSVLLCGGFNRSFLPLAEGLGIRVISGLAGEAERLIEAFLQDEIERYRFLPGRGRRGQRRGVGGRRRSVGRERREPRNRKGAQSCRDTTGPDRAESVPGQDGARAFAANPPGKTEP